MVDILVRKSQPSLILWFCAFLLHVLQEVAKKDYEKEKQAPEGMEWQTWEGQKVPEKKN